MVDGHPGLTGLTVLKHVAMGQGLGKDHALTQPLHMAEKAALEKPIRCRSASSGIAQCTASGLSSQSGPPAVCRVMAASFLALVSLCQRGMVETTAVAT